VAELVKNGRWISNRRRDCNRVPVVTWVYEKGDGKRPHPTEGADIGEGHSIAQRQDLAPVLSSAIEFLWSWSPGRLWRGEVS